MNSRTEVALLPVSQEQAFAYLANIQNLPRWATEFARELRLVDGKYKVVNGLGEFFFQIEADPETGVIDMLAGPSEDELALFPTRVVPLGSEASAFVFTMFQAPEMPDELFENQHQSLRRELVVLAEELAP